MAQQFGGRCTAFAPCAIKLPGPALDCQSLLAAGAGSRAAVGRAPPGATGEPPSPAVVLGAERHPDAAVAGACSLACWGGPCLWTNDPFW